MARLRWLIILFVLWLIVLFNLSRAEQIVIAGTDFALNLSPAVYIIAVLTSLVILLWPDLGQVPLWAVFTPTLVVYVLGRLVVSPFDPYEPKRNIYYFMTEILCLLITVVFARFVSLAISNVEEAVETVFSDGRESRILNREDGIDRFESELARARRFKDRPVGFIRVHTDDLIRSTLPNTIPTLERAFRLRYLQNQIGHIAETAFARNIVMCWYESGLLICLPEHTQEETLDEARRLNLLFSVRLDPPPSMSMVMFPDQALIMEDLLKALASKRISANELKSDEFFVSENISEDGQSLEPLIPASLSSDVRRTTSSLRALTSDQIHELEQPYKNASGNASASTPAPASSNKPNKPTKNEAVWQSSNRSIQQMTDTRKAMQRLQTRTLENVIFTPQIKGASLAFNLDTVDALLNFPETFAKVLPEAHRQIQMNYSKKESPDNPDFWVNRLPYQGLTSRRIYIPVKRILDIMLIVVSAIVWLPIFLIGALLVYLNDRGPIFFVQERTGFGGRLFKMYKFRTMVPNAEALLRDLASQGLCELDENGKLSGPLKLARDPRITRIGRFLRKSSIDELPQLLNVLRGDMSIVGPRPTSWGLNSYSLVQTERLYVRPGITGLWQVYERGNKEFSGWVKWDVLYIEKMSLSLDIRLILLTIVSVVKRKGAR